MRLIGLEYHSSAGIIAGSDTERELIKLFLDSCWWRRLYLVASGGCGHQRSDLFPIIMKHLYFSRSWESSLNAPRRSGNFRAGQTLSSALFVCQLLYFTNKLCYQIPRRADHRSGERQGINQLIIIFVLSHDFSKK